VLVLVLVLLLQRILGKTAHNGTTDCAEDSVVDLVTSKGTC
jgi:hypothetical protein